MSTIAYEKSAISINITLYQRRVKIKWRTVLLHSFFGLSQTAASASFGFLNGPRINNNFEDLIIKGILLRVAKLMGDSEEVKHAVEYTDQILEARREVEERIRKLLKFKEQLRRAKAQVKENMLANERELTDSQTEILDVIKEVSEEALEKINPFESQKSVENLTKLEDKEKTIRKDFERIEEDRNQIKTMKENVEQANIKIIKLNFMDLTKNWRSKLQKYQDEEEEHEIVAQTFDISINPSTALEETNFISVEKNKFVDVDF